MEKEKMLMGQKQFQRWHLMQLMVAGEITLREGRKRCVLLARYLDFQRRTRLKMKHILPIVDLRKE
jgi:hypothetical protein